MLERKVSRRGRNQTTEKPNKDDVSPAIADTNDSEEKRTRTTHFKEEAYILTSIEQQ